MKIERFDDINIDSAMCKDQQKTKEVRQMDCKEQKINVVEDFSLNASQKEEEIFAGNRASAEVQKRDAFRKKHNGWRSIQNKLETEELMYDTDAQQDESYSVASSPTQRRPVQKCYRRVQFQGEIIKSLNSFKMLHIFI